MRLRSLTPSRILPIAVLFLGTQWFHAQQTHVEKTQPPRIVLEEIGKGTVPLNGPWQFHTGDDLAWANPAFDSSGWEQISAERPWGQQGHASLTGFAWYRCRIVLSPASGIEPRFSILIPEIRDAYEIYWNGVLIGHNGKLPPHPVRILSQPAQSFELGEASQGVLAIRVWKAPLLSDDSGELGGFRSAPLIGSSAAIATALTADQFQWLCRRQFIFGENLICAVIAFLSFLLWLQSRDRWLLFWMAAFSLSSPVILLFLNAHLGWSYVIAMGASQPVLALKGVSLWFLLLWLLSLHTDKFICRLTRVLACICLANASLDGMLVALAWNPAWNRFAQISDIILTVPFALFEAFPVVLVLYALGRRKPFDSARWLIASLIFFDEMLVVFSNLIRQGRQFTTWPIANYIDAPFLYIYGSGVSLSGISETLFFIAIICAVYNQVREDQRRGDALEMEKKELILESGRMRYQAEHDGLTGLWNHSVIVERLSQELNRSCREGKPLGVVLIDIDHFKKVNDTYGHLTGDLVLKEIGSIFMRSLRSYDCVGRYGGEEFLLILPNCKLESALMRAEQLRQAVESARIQDRGTTLRVTASFGVVAPFPTPCETYAVIRAADMALYQAKNNGRNRVVHAEVETTLCEA